MYPPPVRGVGESAMAASPPWTAAMASPPPWPAAPPERTAERVDEHAVNEHVVEAMYLSGTRDGASAPASASGRGYHQIGMGGGGSEAAPGRNKFVSPASSHGNVSGGGARGMGRGAVVGGRTDGGEQNGVPSGVGAAMGWVSRPSTPASARIAAAYAMAESHSRGGEMEVSSYVVEGQAGSVSKPVSAGRTEQAPTSRMEEDAGGVSPFDQEEKEMERRWDSVGRQAAGHVRRGVGEASPSDSHSPTLSELAGGRYG
jgi:hypothetical protein